MQTPGSMSGAYNYWQKVECDAGSSEPAAGHTAADCSWARRRRTQEREAGILSYEYSFSCKWEKSAWAWASKHLHLIASFLREFYTTLGTLTTRIHWCGERVWFAQSLPGIMVEWPVSASAFPQNVSRRSLGHQQTHSYCLFTLSNHIGSKWTNWLVGQWFPERIHDLQVKAQFR